MCKLASRIGHGVVVANSDVDCSAVIGDSVDKTSDTIKKLGQHKKSVLGWKTKVTPHQG